MTEPQYPRDVLRIRRYVDGELEAEVELDRDGAELAAVLDAEWCAAQTAAGRRFRIVIDDPWRDIAGALVIEGGAEL